MKLRILLAAFICTIVLLPLEAQAQRISRIDRFAQSIGEKLNSERGFPKNTTIIKETIPLHPNLKELYLLKVLGKPYVSIETDMVLPYKYRFNSASRIYKLKFLARNGLFNKNKRLSAEEIANKQPWYTGFKPNVSSLYRKRTFMNGESMSDEEKRLFDGYQYDEFIREELSVMLTNEAKKLFFESEVKPKPKSNGSLFTPQRERRTPNWGGHEDPLVVSSAYQKFLSSGILDTLNITLRDINVPDEGVSFIYASMFPTSGAFNIKFFLDRFDIPQIDSELRGFSYQLQLPEDEADELKRNKIVRGIVSLKISNYTIINLADAYLKGDSFQSKHTKELVSTVIDFYAMDDFMFEKPLFSVDVKNCKPEKY